MTVASSPMTIEIRVAWTVRLSMLRPSSSVPERVARPIGGASRGPVAVDRRLERPDEDRSGSARRR